MNYRKVSQNNQLNSITETENNIIHTYNKFVYYKNWNELIEANFIMYNEATINLIKKIYKNICANHFTHDKQNFTTFFVTSFDLTDKNFKLSVIRNVDTTKKRILKLEKEGVIGRIVRHGQEGGQFIYLKVDINEPFIRQKQEVFYKSTDNEEQLNVINESEKQDNNKNIEFNDNLILKLKEKDDIIEKLKQEIHELKQKTVATTISETKNDILQPSEDIYVQLSQLNVENSKKEEFKTMFHEFCNKRVNNRGIKIAKKTPRAVNMLVNKIQNFSDAGLDVFEILKKSLSEGWRDIYEDEKYIIDYEKYKKSEFFEKKVKKEELKIEIIQKVNKTTNIAKRQLMIENIKEFDAKKNNIEYNENVFVDGEEKKEKKLEILNSIIIFFEDKITYPSKKQQFKEIALATIKELKKNNIPLTIREFYNVIDDKMYKDNDYKEDVDYFIKNISIDMFKTLYMLCCKTDLKK